MKWRKLSEAMPDDGYIIVLHGKLDVDHAALFLPIKAGDRNMRGFEVRDGELLGAYGFRQSIDDYVKEHPEAEFVQVERL